MILIMTIANHKKLELDENEAWEYYSYLIQKQRDLIDKFVKAIQCRDRALIQESLAKSREISRKLDHVDEFLDQFE